MCYTIGAWKFELTFSISRYAAERNVFNTNARITIWISNIH